MTRLVMCVLCLQHVRMLQLFLCCNILDDLVKDLGGTKQIPVVFCGDFNSDEVSGSIQLLKSGSIPKDHLDWRDGKHSMAWKGRRC